MWLMLQQDKPDDYVIATGETHTIREFAEKAFGQLDMKIRWSGNNENEIGTDEKTGKAVVRVDPKHYRPTEVDLLIGNPAKAQRQLGWKASVGFENLVEIMVKADYEAVSK
jgi:GDPmannose 4,6-dehydratase